MSRTSRIDPWLVPLVALLLGGGLVSLYSSSSWISERWHESPHQMFVSQGIKAALGLVFLVGAARLDYRRLRGPAAWVIWGSVAALLAFLALPGSASGTARAADRWLRIGPALVQPAEMARVAILVLVASLVGGERGSIRRPRELWPLALAVGVPILLVLLQPNFGTALAIGASVIGVLVLAGLPWRWLLGSGGALAASVGLLVLVYPYPLGRIRAWIDGLRDWQALPFQIEQGVIALGSGGTFGVGIGESLQKRQFVPDAHTDLILAIIGEELGFVGMLALLTLFALFLWRGFRIASLAPDRFGYLLAAGLTLQIGLYVLINAGVVTGLLPVTGLPLPFVSYGGSALMANLAAVGVLASISRRAVWSGGRAQRRVMEIGAY